MTFRVNRQTFDCFFVDLRLNVLSSAWSTQPDEINAILRVDNVRTIETGFKACSQQAWDQRYTIDLDRVCRSFVLLTPSRQFCFVRSRRVNWRSTYSGATIGTCVPFDFFVSKIFLIRTMKSVEWSFISNRKEFSLPMFVFSHPIRVRLLSYTQYLDQIHQPADQTRDQTQAPEEFIHQTQRFDLIVAQTLIQSCSSLCFSVDQRKKFASSVSHENRRHFVVQIDHQRRHNTELLRRQLDNFIVDANITDFTAAQLRRSNTLERKPIVVTNQLVLFEIRWCKCRYFCRHFVSQLTRISESITEPSSICSSNKLSKTNINLCT